MLTDSDNFVLFFFSSYSTAARNRLNISLKPSIFVTFMKYVVEKIKQVLLKRELLRSLHYNLLFR